MKLLSKNEIERQRSVERKMEIDEGAKLAHRVDDLRKKSADEDQRLAKFRLASIKTTRDEIAEAVATRDALRGEITKLEEERKLLRIPLDAEWQKVNDRQKQLDTMEQSLSQREKDLDTREQAIGKKESLLKADQDAVANLKAHLEKEARLASEYRVETYQTLVVTRKIKTDTEKSLATREKNVELREKQVLLDQQTNARRSAELDQKNTIVDNKEREVNDRYETLLDTEKIHG